MDSSAFNPNRYDNPLAMNLPNNAELSLLTWYHPSIIPSPQSR